MMYANPYNRYLRLHDAISCGLAYVVPDAGKGTTPDVMVAFTCVVHDGKPAARQKYYRGDQ
jgi:hypothetical protein